MAGIRPGAVVAAKAAVAAILALLLSQSRPTTCPRFTPTPQPRPLKDEVEELVRPWRQSNNKPPFTTGELIVIILVLNDLRPKYLSTIHDEILSIFPYYDRQALMAFVEWHDDQANPYFDWTTLTQVLPGLYETARDFEHPLTCIRSFNPSDDMNICENEYTICAKAARIYLRDKLERPRRGSFNFMGLPAELREKIDKMLLVYPKPGLTLAKRDRQPDEFKIRFGVWSRTDLEIPTYSEAQEVPENEFAVDSLTKLLAILSVSKQVRYEALPVFYGRNALNFGSLDVLARALGQISYGTAQQIQVLRVVVDRSDSKLVGSPLPALAKLRALETPRKLILALPRHSAFWRHFRFDDTENQALRSSELSRINGFCELNEIVYLAKRAKHVEFVGNGFLGDYIRQKIGQPKNAQ